MTPRERILAALEHREADRLPIDFAGTDCSSVHLLTYDRLRRHLGLEPRPLRLGCLAQQVAEVDREIQDRFRGDAAALYFYPQAWRRWTSGYGFDVEVSARLRLEDRPDGSTVSLDAGGVPRAERPAGGFYFDPVNFPCTDVQTPEEFDRYAALFERWDWSPALDEPLDQYAARARQLRASTDRAIVASWRMHYLQTGQLLRGYEQFMIDLLTDEPLVRGLLDRLHAVYLQRIAAFLQAVGEHIDIVFFTDDLGTQNGPLVGPPLYRRLIKPYWSELIGCVKQRGLKVLMHACGAVADFIPDLIEMGVDALNPVQITAAGMTPERLKRDFGRNIAFWGGGVSTQGTLNRATPQAVRDEVRRNIETFAPGGGFVFTQVHNIQAGVPIENILAAFDTAAER